jgi:hypothetical protein
MDELLYRLTYLLPYKLRYWIVIRAAADATTGEWGHTEAPGVNIIQILERMK